MIQHLIETFEKNHYEYELDSLSNLISELKIKKSDLKSLKLISQYASYFDNELDLELSNFKLDNIDYLNSLFNKIAYLDVVNSTGQIHFISTLTNLRSLVLKGNNLSSLEGINLKVPRCYISFENLDYAFFDGAKLEIERLYVTSLNSKNISHTKESFKNLDFLQLSITTTDDLAEIPSYSNVKELDIFIKDRGIRYFSDDYILKLPHLTCLMKLSHCMREVSDDGVKELVGKCPNLEIIDFLGNELITEDCINHLLKLNNLKNVNFQGTNIKTRALKPLAEKFPGISIGYAR